jgi:D-serine deaminase-like pyridoxal phosphate-dependent protein
VVLARLVAAHASLRFDGLMGYEGHVVDEPDRARRAAGVARAAARLADAQERLSEAGLAAAVVSAGGTGTYDLTGAAPGVTEIQAGSYLIMDEFHAAITPEFERALTVVASVLSRHGDLFVVDAGRKAVGGELAPLRLLGHAAEPAFSHEEHSGFRLRAGAGAGPAVGERVRIVPGYAPTTVNLHAVLWATRNGLLVDGWRVRGRHGDP